MKTTSISTFVILIFLLVNCGDGGKAEQARMDVLAKDSLMRDSVAKVEAAASLAETIDLHTQTPSDKKFIKTADLKFKVANVLFATEKIEDLSVRYGGYMVYSNLQNRNENYRSSRISSDSMLVSKEIVVENSLQLRVPNERVDSFVRDLNSLVLFFDYRTIKMEDVTYQFLASQKKNDRFQKYEQRQTQHIDNKQSSKLKETTTAEDNLLDRQNQADDLQVNLLSLQDQVKYCNMNIEIYQKSIIVKEVIADFDNVSRAKPGFFTRFWGSVVIGWHMLEEVVIFLVKIWGIVLLIIAMVFGINYLGKVYSKMNSAKNKDE